jgi:hypothetical protein
VVAASFISSTEVQCHVAPLAPQTLSVSAGNSETDVTTATLSLTVEALPTLFEIEPASGPSQGNNVVSLRGGNFDATGKMTCRFGSVTVQAHFVEQGLIECVVPANIDGSSNTVAVYVSKNDVDFSAVSAPYTYQESPVITSVEPQVVLRESATTALTISGSNFDLLKDQQLTCAGLSPASVLDSSTIACDVPQQSETGHISISVTNVQGEMVVSMENSVVVVDAPLVSGVYPPFATALDEDEFDADPTFVVVEGEHFHSSSSLTCLFGTLASPSVNYISPTRVECEVPFQLPGTISQLRVSNNAGASLSTASSFEYHSLAQIFSVAPSTGVSGGGTLVSVAGANFFRDSSLECVFGSKAVPARFVSSTLVECVSPPGAISSVELSLTSSGALFYEEASLSFEYVADAAGVVSLSPNSGSLSGGTPVTVELSGTSPSNVISCRFGAAATPSPATPSADSEAAVVCISPASTGSESDVVAVEITTDGSLFSSSSTLFAYSTQPTVFGLSPSSGPESGGTALTISGSNFVPSASIKCAFGDASTTTSAGRFVSTTTVTCASPANLAPGSHDVTLSFDGGATFYGSSNAPFTSYPAVTIFDLLPSSGPKTGGTPVTVTGSNFEFSSLLKCKFDNSVVSAVFVSSSEVICHSPAQDSLKHSAVSVTNNGLDFSEAPVTFEYAKPVTVTSFSPLLGPKEGGTAVIVKGANFGSTVGSVFCMFGSQLVEGVVNSVTEIACLAPPSSDSAVELSIVTQDSATHSLPSAYTYHSSSEVFGVAPSSGPSNLVHNVIATGANFVNSPSICCRLKDAPSISVSASFLSSSSVLCTIPSTSTSLSSKLATTLQVSNNCVDFESTSASPYEITEAAVYTSISPASGSVFGGTLVTVAGSNFVHSGSLKCHFGSLLTPVDARFVDANTIECVAPSNQVDGAGVVGFSLSSMGSLFFDDAGISFEYFSEDSGVVSVTPNAGLAVGGTSVMVEVVGAAAADITHCKFGDVAVPVSSVASVNTVTCASPPSTSEDAVAVEISTNGGADFTTSSVYFTYASTPTVFSISPSAGPADSGGTVITVAGANFVPSTSITCEFGSSSLSSSARFVSSTTLTCPTPAGLPPAAHQIAVSFNSGSDFASTRLPAFSTFTTFTEPKVASVHPALGSAAGGTTVTVAGSSFEYSPKLACVFDGINTAPATLLSPTSISCVVPPLSSNPGSPSQQTVQLRVTANGVDYSSSSTSTSFTYVPAPTVASISPARGPVSGGTEVTVTGTNFVLNADAVCRFGGIETTGIVISSTLATCSSPPHAEDTVSVSVSMNSGGDFTSSSAASFSFRSALLVTSVLPTGALASEGGSFVTVFGANFVNTEALTCRFGSTLLSPSAVFVSSTQVNCEVPVSPTTKTTFVEVSNNGADFTADGVAFTFFGHPAVHALSPESGSTAGGTAVVVTGRNFLFTERTVCRFGHVNVFATFVDSKTLECVAPAKDDLHASSAVDVEVSNNGLGFTASGKVFSYAPAATIASVSPFVGVIGGSTTLTLSGSDFTPVGSSGGVFCRFQAVDGPKATATEALAVLPGSISGETVLCPTPARPSEDYDEYFVEVSSNGQDFSSSMKTFAYRPMPKISSVYPLDGSAKGGTTVTITGTNFVQTDVIACKFGDGADANEVVPARFVSSTLLWCTTGDVSAATSSVTTVRPVHVSFNGEDYVHTGFKFSFILPHTVTHLSPSHGPVQGSTAVSIYGTSFRQSQYIGCKFNEEAAPGRFVSSTEVVCTSPPQSAGAADVSVTLNGEDYVDVAAGYSLTFLYEVGMTVTAVEPMLGHFDGGAVVTVSGTNFVDTGSDLLCKFGTDSTATTAVAAYVSPTAVVCTAPARTSLYGLESEMVYVRVSSNGGDDYTDVGGATFTYVHTPTVATLAPATAFEQTGGVKLLVSGSNFFDNKGLVCVFDNDVSILTVAKWLSSTMVQCPTPSNLPSLGNSRDVPVKVSNNYGVEESSTSAALRVTSKASFTINFSPSTGTTTGGTVVTVFTSVWSLTAESSCLFGDVKTPAQQHPTDPKALTCRTPSHVSGPVDLKITSDGVHNEDVGTFTFVPAPSVSAIEPSLGDKMGGTLVTLSGANLESSVSCRFGSRHFLDPGSVNLVVPVVSASASEVVCAVPAVVDDGNFDDRLRTVEVGSSSGDFTFDEMQFGYLDAIRVINAYPRSGPMRGNTTVLVNGRGFVNTPTLKCRFGDTASGVVPARWLSSSQLSCITASVEVTGEVDVYVSVNGLDFASTSAKYHLDAPLQIVSVAPAYGPVRGGTVVTVFANNLRYTGAVGCRFGDKLVTASFVDGGVNEVACIAPTTGEAGAVEVGITLNGVDYDNVLTNGVDSTFEYVPVPEVTSVHPKSGWRSGGVELTLQVDNLALPHSGGGASAMAPEDLSCSFGNKNGYDVLAPVTEYDVAGGFVKCLSPSQKQKDTSLTSQVNDLDDFVGISLVYSSSPKSHEASGVLFRFIDAVLVDRIVPMSGPQFGGTKIHVYGENFLNEQALVCVFADAASSTQVATSLAEFMSGSLVSCASPAYHDGPSLAVSVASSDDVLRTHRTMAAFAFFPEPQVFSVSPAWGGRGGGTVVTVSGHNFGRLIAGDVNPGDAVNHQLMCRFGNNTHPSPARYISDQSLECSSPTAANDVRAGSAVFLEISLNGGYDWTASGVEFTFGEEKRLTHVEPKSGVFEGGTAVLVHGTGLDSAAWDAAVASGDDLVWCHFDDVTSKGSVVLAPTQSSSAFSVACDTPVTPLGVAGTVKLELSFNSYNDATSSNLDYTYYEQAIISSVFPTKGVRSGGDAVAVSGARFADVPELSCKFGQTEASRVVFVDANRIKCFAPSHGGDLDGDGSTVAVSVSNNGVDYTTQEVGAAPTFTFDDFPSVSEIVPAVVSAAGGSATVQIMGKHLKHVIACRWGELGSAVRVGSYEVDALTGADSIRCSVPKISRNNPMVGTDAELYLSVEGGRQFIGAGLTVHYEAGQADTSLYEETLAEEDFVVPRLTSVYPSEVSSTREQWVTVYGEDFVNRAGLGCMFGATFAEADFISATELRCATPSRPPGAVVLEVVNGGSSVLSTSNTKFVFTVDPSLSSVLPSFGPMSGNTVVSIFGSNLVENGVTERDGEQRTVVLCRFGKVQVLAASYSNNVIRCAVPESPQLLNPSTVRLDVSSNNGTSWSASYLTYSYERFVEVQNVNPSRGVVEGGTSVLVEGYRFKNTTDAGTLKCKFGASVVDARYISETQLLCASPPRSAGVVDVEVTTNGYDYSWTGIEYEYYQRMTVASIWPKVGGAMIGNTVVTVHGTGFAAERELSCLFGETLVAAKALSDTVLRCASPPRRPGLASFRVVRDGYMGGWEYALNDGGEDTMNFLYVRDPSVFKIVPETGRIEGGNPVFVQGTNFINSTALGCRFGVLPTRGTIINENTMVCIAPAVQNAQSVPVTVTLNGADYSELNLDVVGGGVYNYVSGCLAGQYCGGDGSYGVPAPNGTVVPANNALNFTLCEPGTFQPRNAQTECIPCPVSYFCPDFGLSKPVICPAGMICDVTGLVTPVVACPDGHYCKRGTKTSDLTTFQGVHMTDWVTGDETELTVVKPDAEMRPWAYVNRTAPATGWRRIEHPPESDPALRGDLDHYEYFDLVTAERPLSCPVGHYCKVQATTDLPSPLNFSTPQRCFDGFFCPRGSSTPQGTGPCPTGFYCPSQERAVECPAGHYCPGVGNIKPIECYPGTHNPFVQQSNCTLCATGHICPGWGRLLPETCPAGFVCASLGLSGPSILCPPGYYCEEGTLTLDAADPHVKGPKACGAGIFCLGGTAHNMAIEWVPGMSEGGSAPQVCTEGSYCETASSGPEGSGPCFPGHYCPPGSIYPITVPLGTFAGSVGSVASTLCFPGSYAPLVSAEQCRPCPAGFTCQGYGTYEPRICQAGTYRSVADSVTCRLCPAGTFSPYSGATDITSCFPCPEGRVCGMQGMDDLKMSVSCPGGYTCGAGTNRATQFNHKCPAGYVCAPNTIPTDQYLKSCVKGHYCLRGTPEYLATRNKCQVGYFCPKGTSAPTSPLTKCPRRTVSFTGASDLKECMIEQVDVCDKFDLSDRNPFEYRSYYPQHSYSLLSYDEVLNDEAPVIEFNSMAERNPTGEVEVLRKIIPTKVGESIPQMVNDTVEVFRTCTNYGLEDEEDVVTVVGRNFRDSSLLSCRFTACIQADWSPGQSDGGSGDTDYNMVPRMCRNFDGSPLPDTMMSKKKVIVPAKFISDTRVECQMPNYSFNKTKGYSWMDEYNMNQEVAFQADDGSTRTFMGATWIDDSFEDAFDVIGHWSDFPNEGNRKVDMETDFRGKCKRDPEGKIYYLQKCTQEQKESGGICHPDGGATDYVDKNGNLVEDGGTPNHMRMYSLVIDCTDDEKFFGYCDNLPELGQRLNPCMTAQVTVEVSNNGDKFSNDYSSYEHTVRSDNDATNQEFCGSPPYEGLEAENCRGKEPGEPTGLNKILGDGKALDYYKEGTFTTFTFISKELSEDAAGLTAEAGEYRDAYEEIKATDKSICSRPVYAEEGERASEQGWFEFPFLSYAQLSFDFTQIPPDMVYNEHYKVAIYATPSRCTDEWCSKATRTRQPAQDVMPCLQPIDLPKWFQDPSVNKNQIVNMTMLSMEDSMFKVEVHIVHGGYLASADYLRNTMTVQLMRPDRAMVSEGEQLLIGSDKILAERTRRKSPHISWEESMMHSEFIFGIRYTKEMSEGVSPPLNMPPRFEDYSRGKLLVMMNTTYANKGVPFVRDEKDDVLVTNAWWEVSNLYPTPR